MKTSLHFLLLSSTATTFATYIGLGLKLELSNSSNTYKTIPLSYPYGREGKVMTSMIFGSSNNTAIPVVIDLGSADFWVFGPNTTVNYGSTSLGVQGPCNVTPSYFYDPSESSTATDLRNFASQYNYGGNYKIIRGIDAVNDTLSFPSSLSNSKIENVEVALEDYAIIRSGVLNDVCSPLDYDYSILGLGPFTNETSGPPFRENLYSQGVTGNRIQSMWMTANDSTNATFSGTALFGALDTSKFSGQLVELDLVTGYSINKASMSANGVSFTTSYDASCLVDSGSIDVTLPIPDGEEESSNFYNATGLVEDNGSLVYPTPCDEIPEDLTMEFSFTSRNNGTEATISIPYKYFVRGETPFSRNVSECALSIATGSSCVYGAPFFTGAFFAADDSRGVVGLAQGGILDRGDVCEEDLVYEIVDGLVGSGKLVAA